MKKLKDLIKVAAFDIDGTLLPNGYMKFPENIKTMFQELKNRNITTVVASAREFASIGDFLDQLSPVDYFVGANGAFIWDVKKQEFLYKSTIDKNVVKQIYNEFQDTDVQMSITDFDKAYKSPNMKLDTWFIKPFKANYLEYNDELLKNTDLYLITFGSDQPKELSLKVQEYIDKHNLNVQIESRWSRGFWVSPKNVNKSKTLKILCESLGYSLDNLIAFGDSSNDYEMIRDALYGVAMQRASQKLKTVAKDIALDCEFEGCYLKLKELKLI